MTTQEKIPLAPLTTFQIGGPARFFVRVQTLEALQRSLAFAREKSLRTLFLGGGSNILVDDAGFDGLVIKVEIPGVEERGATLVSGAGESWDALVARAVENGLWGIENLSGIPGSVGGAVVQNIGAYGAALSQTLVSVEVYDTQQERVRELSASECALGYRNSIFKQEEGRYVVVRATFELSAVPAPNLSYRDLASRFAGATPSLRDIRAAVLDIRSTKFPDLSVEGSAGSFFKNPILPVADAEALRNRYPGLPLFDMPEVTGAKVPLAWLFDNVLHLKGVSVGGARAFERQPLVIAAARDTSAREVRALVQKIKDAAREKLLLEIEPEVKIL
jgi:UDP-N-acetylmuramate dehydrogenase